MQPAKVLIIEDDSDIAFILERALRKEGFQTSVLYLGREIGKAIDAFRPDLVLLDLKLPDIDGYAVCRIIKQCAESRHAKVIMLTAKTEEPDILSGFDAGADDFIKKPFQLQEVVARAKAVLRRHAPSKPTSNSRSIQRGPLVIDNGKHEVTLHGQALHLTISEYRLLVQLASRPDRVFTRDQLAECISDSDHAQNASVNSRNIDVHIRSLRKKLGDESHLIKTLRGVGYYFRKLPSPAVASQS